MLAPREFATVHNRAADAGAVAADVFGQGVHDDIRAMLERPQLIRRRERTVNDKRDLMGMRDRRHRLDIDEIRVRVADGLDIDSLRIRLHRVRKCLYPLRRVDERRLDAEIREGMLQKVVGAAIDRRRRHDMLPRVHERLQRIRHRCRPRSRSQRRHAALQRRQAALQHILRRVREAAVYIARILQREAIRRMLRIAEHIRSRLIDRHRPRIRRRIRRLLPYVKLQCLKLIFSLCHDPFPFS